MYPLDVVLIGCSPGLVPQVKRELAGQAARVVAEYPDARGFAAHESQAAEWTGGARAAPERSRLLVVHLKSPDDYRPLRELAAAQLSHPVLALLEAPDDPAAVVQAMREGAQQVVLLPLQSEDFQKALEQVARQIVHPGAHGRVIAVAGVNGGCGTTTLALNLAYELAGRHELPTVLVELAVQMGALAAYLGITPAASTRDLLADAGRLGRYAVQKALTRVADNLEVLAGPLRVAAPTAVDPGDVLRMIDAARQLAAVVVVDVPCTFDAVYFDTCSAADQVVLVAEQKVLSVRALQMIGQALDQSAPFRPRYPVVNRYHPRLPGFTAPELADLLGLPQVLTVSEDPAVAAAADRGRLLRAAAPHSRALADIAALAQTLLTGGTSRSKPGGSGIFGQLRRVIGLR